MDLWAGRGWRARAAYGFSNTVANIQSGMIYGWEGLTGPCPPSWTWRPRATSTPWRPADLQGGGRSDHVPRGHGHAPAQGRQVQALDVQHDRLLGR